MAHRIGHVFLGLERPIQGVPYRGGVQQGTPQQQPPERGVVTGFKLEHLEYF
jgi:hypothetical protein